MSPETIDQNATLLVVDVQAVTLPNARSVPADVLAERIGVLVDAFRASGRAVAYAISTGTHGGRTDVQSMPRRWREQDLVVPTRIQPQRADPVYRWTGWSAFAGTELSADLRRRGSAQVVVTGLATSYGVESTVRAAHDLGLDVVVPLDAVSDPDFDAHRHVVQHIFPLLATTTLTEDLVGLVAVNA